MARFEYCAVGPIKNSNYGTPKFGNYPQFIQFTAKGIVRTNLAGKEEDEKLGQLIYQLGVDGWELVSTGDVLQRVESDIRYNTHLLYFKRQLE